LHLNTQTLLTKSRLNWAIKTNCWKSKKKHVRFFCLFSCFCWCSTLQKTLSTKYAATNVVLLHQLYCTIHVVIQPKLAAAKHKPKITTSITKYWTKN